MKTITIAGRLTRDAEIRMANGDKLAAFSVAVDDRTTRDKGTFFFDCTLWGKRGEALQPHLTKGTPITVSGELTRREHDGKTYLGVRVNDVTLQGGRRQQGDEENGAVRREEPRGGSRGSLGNDLDDEIPFLPEWR